MKLVSGARRLMVLVLAFVGPLDAHELNAPPQDHAEIRSIIEAIGVFADFGEFEAICQLYDSYSVSDYSSLWNNQPSSGSPSNRATGWSGFIPGFDATRHSIEVMHIKVNGTSASAVASVVADHWLNGEYWGVAGAYDAVLVKKKGRWLISEWVFTLFDESGDRRVVDRAEEIAESLIDRPIQCEEES